MTTVSWLQRPARLEVARDGQGRRAGIEHDALAVAHERRRGGPDPGLLVRLEALADLERELRAAVVEGDGAAVGPDQAVVGLERHQVLADGDRGDAEPAGEVGHPGAAVLLDDPGDPFLSLTGEDVGRGDVGWGGHASPRGGHAAAKRGDPQVSFAFRRTVGRTRTQLSRR